MFLRHLPTTDMVEILDMTSLFDPSSEMIIGRFHAGEEMPEPTYFSKYDMAFPSGESLPRCWLDSKFNLRAA